MNANINLLLRKDEVTLKRKRRAKILNLVAILILLFVGITSFSLFMLTQSVNISSIKKEEADVLAKMSEFQDQQTKLLIVNDRVMNIGKILKLRKDLPKTINSLLAKIPDKIIVENFEVDDKSVVISGQSSSLVAVGELINNFTDMVHKKEIIKSLTLNSLSLNETNNTYQVSIKSEL